MVALRAALKALFEIYPAITNNEIYRFFPKEKVESIKVYTSQFRKEYKIAADEPQKETIDLKRVEKIIAEKINKNPTNQDLKLAVEVLKLKAQDKGMDDDLDIEKYIKTSKSVYDQDKTDETEDTEE